MKKVLLIELFIYFQGEISFLTGSGRSNCFELFILFNSSVLLLEMKSLFFSLWKFVSCHYWKHKLVFQQILNQCSVPSNITLLYILVQTLYILFKMSKLKRKFLRHLSALVKICQISHVNFETTRQFLFKLCIILQCHGT